MTAEAPLGRVAKGAGEDGVLGSDAGNEAVGELRVFDVTGDLGVERLQVVVVHERGGGEVGLLQPAEFLALRAICEDAEEIAFDCAVDEGVDTVEEVVG